MNRRKRTPIREPRRKRPPVKEPPPKREPPIEEPPPSRDRNSPPIGDPPPEKKQDRLHPLVPMTVTIWPKGRDRPVHPARVFVRTRAVHAIRIRLVICPLLSQ